MGRTSSSTYVVGPRMSTYGDLKSGDRWADGDLSGSNWSNHARSVQVMFISVNMSWPIYKSIVSWLFESQWFDDLFFWTWSSGAHCWSSSRWSHTQGSTHELRTSQHIAALQQLWIIRFVFFPWGQLWLLRCFEKFSFQQMIACAWRFTSCEAFSSIATHGGLFIKKNCHVGDLYTYFW